jgi:hypothetical protein
MESSFGAVRLRSSSATSVAHLEHHQSRRICQSTPERRALAPTSACCGGFPSCGLRLSPWLHGILKLRRNPPGFYFLATMTIDAPAIDLNALVNLPSCKPSEIRAAVLFSLRTALNWGLYKALVSSGRYPSIPLFLSPLPNMPSNRKHNGPLPGSGVDGFRGAAATSSEPTHQPLHQDIVNLAINVRETARRMKDIEAFLPVLLRRLADAQSENEMYKERQMAAPNGGISGDSRAPTNYAADTAADVPLRSENKTTVLPCCFSNPCICRNRATPAFQASTARAEAPNLKNGNTFLDSEDYQSQSGPRAATGHHLSQEQPSRAPPVNKPRRVRTHTSPPIPSSYQAPMSSANVSRPRAPEAWQFICDEAWQAHCDRERSGDTGNLGGFRTPGI